MAQGIEETAQNCRLEAAAHVCVQEQLNANIEKEKIQADLTDKEQSADAALEVQRN